MVDWLQVATSKY